MHFRLKNDNNFHTWYKNVEKSRTLQAIFSVFYNISRPNFVILLLLKGSFRNFVFCLDLPIDKKIVYNANCPLENIETT
jgi:hypothetical protein